MAAHNGEVVDRDHNAARNLRGWPDHASCGRVRATAPSVPGQPPRLVQATVGILLFAEPLPLRHDLGSVIQITRRGAERFSRTRGAPNMTTTEHADQPAELPATTAK